MSQQQLDPYTAAVENTEITPQTKIDGLNAIVKANHFGMLTTISPSGEVHSRCMAPASTEGLVFQFLANNASHKFDEIQANSNVNLSFIDTSTTNWASIAGRASITRDQALIEKLWSPQVGAYFTDLGDGVHKGDKHDPRVSVICVTPTEIRYWVSNSTAVGRAYEHAKGAVTGKVATPGELRTITPDELQLVFGLNKTH
ncbi:hypothetical protein M408DRAFT_328527 [Serendipita vermifera MAFF 305830]|uniref:General stress protein FMN-binding split barrel domain-containing protein n=1 Tax=Serendipita vermifera MAFF 305830 TaxID=933852 RepID=A0A0C2WU40_SERVB|nr:hypothetical protein M408DRAFT_328527 [Serendipita vermifera MAFF 305830]